MFFFKKIFLLGALSLLLLGGLAQEDKKEPKEEKKVEGVTTPTEATKSEEPAKTEEVIPPSLVPPTMSPEEMEKKAIAFATPSLHHEYLMPLVGNWVTHSKFWHDPQKPPVESPGKAKIEWALGGRYLMSHYDGQVMGKPFKGLGVCGYNNFTQQYQNFWIDTMGTAMYTSKGSYDATTKVLQLQGTMDDPIVGASLPMKEVLRIESYLKHSLEMYGVLPEGKEIKVMEIVYTRE
jgi:hypothetical protein